jgi:hypothetical protein
MCDFKNGKGHGPVRLNDDVGYHISDSVAGPNTQRTRLDSKSPQPVYIHMTAPFNAIDRAATIMTSKNTTPRLPRQLSSSLKDDH